jgi:hypothetical protein
VGVGGAVDCVESGGWPVRFRGTGNVVVDEVAVSGSGGWRVGVGKLGDSRIVRLKWRVAGGSRRSCGPLACILGSASSELIGWEVLSR